MVQIIRENRKPTTGEKFKQAISAGLETAAPFVNEYYENKKLNELTGVDLQGVRDPSVRQALIQDQIKFQRSKQEAQADANILAGKRDQDKLSLRDEILQEPRAARKAFPGFLQQGEEEFTPSKKQRREEPEVRQKQQPQSPEELYADRTPEEFNRAVEDLINLSIAENRPINRAEAINAITHEENVKKSYREGQQLNKERRQAEQAKYGNYAVQRLENIYPNPPDETRDYFRKVGEDYAKENPDKSEAEIQKHLSTEVKNFKNNIASIKKKIGPPRLFSKSYRTIMGTDRESEKARDDIRIKLKPLLDKGFYDTARKLLSELDYYPEEREEIISSLDENAKKSLAQLPTFNKTNVNKFPFEKKEYTTETIDKIYNSLSDILSKNPTTNLLLLRKEYEKKGVEWDTFKDQINKLIFSGQYKPSDDQFDFLDELEQPPLNNGDQILYKMGLIGR